MALLTPDIQTSGLQSCESLSVCRRSHPRAVPQPRDTNTRTQTEWGLGLACATHPNCGALAASKLLGRFQRGDICTSRLYCRTGVITPGEMGM